TLQTTIRGRPQQRSLAAWQPHIYPGACMNKKFHDLRLPMFGGIQKRKIAIVGSIGIGSGGKQFLDSDLVFRRDSAKERLCRHFVPTMLHRFFDGRFPGPLRFAYGVVGITRCPGTGKSAEAEPEKRPGYLSHRKLLTARVIMYASVVSL